jgi:hypothetical protein
VRNRMIFTALASAVFLSLIGTCEVGAQTFSLNNPAVLQRFGLQKSYVVNGKTVSIEQLTSKAQARARQRFSDLQQARTSGKMQLMSLTIQHATTSQTETSPTNGSIGGIAAFAVEFGKICWPQWSTGQACYVDVSSSSIQKWNNPPAGPGAPPSIGFTASSPSPSPLPVDAAKTLSSDVQNLEAISPKNVFAMATPSTPPDPIKNAINNAVTVTNGSQMAPISHSYPYDVKNGSGTITVNLSYNFTPPAFVGSGAAYGSQLTSAATMTAKLSLPFNQNINFTRQLANVVATAQAPLNGGAPTGTLSVTTNLLGTTQSLYNQTATGPTLQYGDARSGIVVQNPCTDVQQAFMIAPSVDIIAQLSCPVTIGYWLGINAVPSEASIILAPAASVGLGATGELNAAAGLLVVSADANEDLLTLQGRIGAYADLVCDPRTPGTNDGVYVIARPFAYGLATAGDGYFYVVAKLAGTKTYIKVANWSAVLNQQIPDAFPTLTAAKLGNATCGGIAKQ